MTRHSILLLLILLVLGCGNGNIPLKGRVVFEDDGSPLTVGTVLLCTPTMQSRGDLDKDGYFTVATLGTKDGLPAGTYNVGIVGANEDLPDGSLKALLEDKWYSPQTSGLTVQIDKGMKNLEIKVTRPKVQAGR